MFGKRLNQANKRDVVLIAILLIIVGGLFLYFQMFMVVKDANFAHVYYGTNNDPIVTIDFVNEEVITYRNQSTDSDYIETFPIIDPYQYTITLLGDYEIDGIRQIVVIKYNFGEKSVEIIQEESPQHICSNEGVSTGKPLICLPNRVRVEFEASDDSDFTV